MKNMLLGDELMCHVSPENKAPILGSKMFPSMRAVGARRAFSTSTCLSNDNHAMHRISENLRDRVINKWSQTHDIARRTIWQGSQFTKDAAEKATMAMPQADHSACEISQGNI